MKINSGLIQNILIIKLRGIGDVVLSTIVLDNLLEEFPDANIDFLTDKVNFSVLDGLPQINSVIEFDRKNIFNRIKLFLKIRLKKYDLILDLFSNPATAQLTFFSGARYRIGFPYRGRKYAYNLFGPEERGKFHTGILHLEVLKTIGLKYLHQSLYFYLDNKSYSFANNYFKTNDLNNNIVVGVIPSGGWSSKRCEPEKFAEISDKIVQKYRGHILILWGPDDYNDAKMIYDTMNEESILAPKTTLKEMGALISKCDFVIANDSGPMHIAVSLDVPTLSLHGPTDPNLQGPLGKKHEWIRLEELECIGCNLLECPKNHECFTELQIEKIMFILERLIRKNNIL